MRTFRVPPADRAILTGLAVLGILLLGSLIYPFAGVLLFAAVLAGACYSWFERLAKKLRGRSVLAAAVLTMGVAVVVAAPTLWIGLTTGRELLTGAGLVDRAFRSGGGIRQVIDSLPSDMRDHARDLIRHVPGGADQIDDLAEKEADKAASVVKGALLGSATFVVKVSLMLVAFFFFLVDGKPLVKWIANVAPLPERQILEILKDFRNVSVAVLLSSLGTAGAQSLAAMAGYLVAQAPQPFFFAFITFIFAFIPAIGASSVVFFVSILLYLLGREEAAIGLALWGALVVSLIDNVVKPWLLQGRMEIHGGLIFFALIGGLAMFGPIGIVCGPLILSFFLAVVRLCRREEKETLAAA